MATNWLAPASVNDLVYPGAVTVVPALVTLAAVLWLSVWSS